MLLQIIRVLQFVALAGTLASAAYYIICIWGAISFLKHRKNAAARLEDLPPVSILKPLRGIDPGMYESFRSYCQQDYPHYEIIFGVSEPNDPAIACVQRLQQEFPRRNICLVHCEQKLGANVKVSNLAQILERAQNEHLVVSDSDIRVTSDYLRAVAGPLADPQIGLVTCLYRGVACSSVGSRLEALGIATDFCAGVLAARQLEGIRFGLGSTLAFRRRDLLSVGGFESLADYLADDYELGKRITLGGKKVVLSDAVVESFLPQYSFGQFLQHQLRWARTLRASRPGGYFGLILTFGFPWALLTLFCSMGAAWAWYLLGAMVIIKIAVAYSVGTRSLRDPQVMQWLWLLPIRDLVAVPIWIGSYTGSQVAWRGDLFTLKDGKLARN
ncbi:MAG TPA: bacteriohopanetetrol glucosamine biosynthesis glycosyltransferase HpnI [Terriglobales bacterium]|jgi:ceramide glucosyltransferase